MSKYRYLAYIILLLPVFIFRDFTPSNELKYISIIEEALRNNTWFTFYNQGEIYADKPPLYFWLLMLSRLITGGYHMWIMGLFSLVPAVGVMAVMDRWLRLDGVKHSPLASNMMLLSTGYFLGSALVLRMDILMTFFIVLSLYTFYRLYSGRSKPCERWLLPVWVFLAVFSKGAMGVLIPMVSIVVFLFIKRRPVTFWKYFGWRQWAILLVLCGAWFGMIYAEGGSEYLNNILFKQTVGRGVNSFHHKEPFWYYVPRVFMTFAPWSLFCLLALWKGARGKLFATDTEKLFFTVVWVNFLMLSLISSKIDIYMLPIYPFVIYLASSMLGRIGRQLLSKIALTVPMVVTVLLFPVSFFITGLVPYEFESLVMVRIALFVLSSASVLALYCLWSGRPVSSVIFLSGGLLLMVFFASFSIPQLNGYLGLGKIAADARVTAEKEGIAAYNYYRFYTAPNMDVYLDHPLNLLESVSQLDSADLAPARSILFVRDKDVARNADFAGWLAGRDEMGRTGKHSWYIIGAGAEPAEELAEDSMEFQPRE